MIYDIFISSQMITHWCFLLPWCSGWAVCLLCAECAQPLVSVHSSNPALETATYSYSGFFIQLYCWSSSAKYKMCRVLIIFHLQLFDLTIAITLPRGRRGGVLSTQGSGEGKPRAVPSGATAEKSTQLTSKFKASCTDSPSPSTISCPEVNLLSLSSQLSPPIFCKSERYKSSLTALHSYWATSSLWLHSQLVLGT